MSFRLSQIIPQDQDQARREGLKNLDKVDLRRGLILEGQELEDYCKKRGLCPICAQTKTKKKVFRLFKKLTWDALTVLNKDGSYQVYKGYCVKPGCFTLEQAKRIVGEAVFPTLSKRVLLRQKILDKEEDSDEYSHDNSEEEDPTGTHDAHQRTAGAFPAQELLHESLNLVDGAEEVEPIPVISSVIEGLHPSSNTIKILELTGLKMRSVDFEFLAKGLKVSTALTAFIFENSKLNDINLEVLASGLEAAKDMPLKKLFLRTNLLGNSAMEALAPFLQANTTLERLDVSRNCITSPGAFAIFAAFIHNRLTRIRYLNLSRNKLENLEDGASGIGEFLTRNRSLRILNLEGNHLDDPSVESLADGLKLNEHTVLERLYLGWNAIGDIGAIALARMLETNKTILIIGLAENCIQNAGARALLSCLDVNFTVKDITGLWRNLIQRRFFVVAMRKLLLSDDRSKSLQAKQHEQALSNDAGQISGRHLNLQPQPDDETSDIRSEVGTDVSSLTNDLDSSKIELEHRVPSLSDGQLQRPSQGDLIQQSDQYHEFLYDRLVILQSTPLVTFDRHSAVNRPIRLYDYDCETIRIQESLCQPISGDIDTEVHVATLDCFSAFFQKKSNAHILHLSCTGPPAQFTWESDGGAVQTLSLEGMKRLYFYRNIDLKIVIVSSRQAKFIGHMLIHAGVRHVLCCQNDHRYSDQVAIDFLGDFYRAAAARKNLKKAFQMAWSAAASGKHLTRISELSNRFQLLPVKPEEDLYHHVPVFFAEYIEPNPVESSEFEIPLHLPRVPEHFLGREVEMFELLKAIRAVDVIHVVGPPKVGKDSVVSAACHYAWKRREMMRLDHLLWLPAPPVSTVGLDDALNVDLNTCVRILREAGASDVWQTNNIILGCQQRIEIELEEKRCLIVIDQRKFDTRYAQVGLEQFVTFLLNFGTAKVLLIETRSSCDGGSQVSSISAISRETLRLEEATIEIHPLSFKSSAQLFAENCKFITSGRCPAAHTSAEFADLLEPVKPPDPITRTTKRRSDLFQRIGLGYPDAVRDAAASMDKVAFMELILIAVRPDVFVDSMTLLELELERKTMEQIQAVEDKNYYRAHSLDELLEDLEMLRTEFPDLERLKREQEALKRQLYEAARNRRYDIVNDLKRELLGIKRNIMKEQRNTDMSSVTTTSEKINDITQKANAMILECRASVQPKWPGGKVTFVFSGVEDHHCSFVISVGNVWEYTQCSATNGIVCWTNECCELQGTLMGDPLLRMGSADLRRDLSQLAEIVITPYGSVRCVTGNAVVVGPTDFGEFVSTFLLLAVGPFSSYSNTLDHDDGFVTPESLAYAKRTLRSCYRSSMVLAKHSNLQALALCLSTPPEGSEHYMTCLQVGLQTLVDEAPISQLQAVHVLAQSTQEAILLKSMLQDMGHWKIQPCI